MLCEKLRFELLAAREQRDRHRLTIAAETPQTLLQIGLNLPGADKSAARGKDLLRWALRQLQQRLPAAELLSQGEDQLGCWAIMTSQLPATTAKQRAVAVESLLPAARLLDIDVYSAQGRAVGRKQLGYPARQCFLCAQAAVDCMRLQRHTISELKERVDELFATFRA